MCLGIPAQVAEFVEGDASLAKVDIEGLRRVISVALLEEEQLHVGDWVLVHVGFALSKIDAKEAELTLDQVKKLGTPYEEEIEAIETTMAHA